MAVQPSPPGQGNLIHNEAEKCLQCAGGEVEGDVLQQQLHEDRHVLCKHCLEKPALEASKNIIKLGANDTHGYKSNKP